MARGGSLGGRGGSRAVSMRDAEEDPPSDRGDGRCCIAWDIEGQNLVTSTSHAHFFFHSSSSSPAPAPLHRLSHHRTAVTSIAVSPSGRSVASGSLDHSVKLYSYPGSEIYLFMQYIIPFHSNVKLIWIFLSSFYTLFKFKLLLRFFPCIF